MPIIRIACIFIVRDVILAGSFKLLRSFILATIWTTVKKFAKCLRRVMSESETPRFAVLLLSPTSVSSVRYLSIVEFADSMSYLKQLFLGTRSSRSRNHVNSMRNEVRLIEYYIECCSGSLTIRIRNLIVLLYFEHVFIIVHEGTWSKQVLHSLVTIHVA